MSTEKNVSKWYSCFSYPTIKMAFSPQSLDEEFHRHQESREQQIRTANNAQDMSRTSPYANASRPVSSYTFSHDGMLRTPKPVTDSARLRPSAEEAEAMRKESIRQDNFAQDRMCSAMYRGTSHTPPLTPARAVEPATENTGVYRNYVSQSTSTEPAGAYVSVPVPKKVVGVVKELFEQDWNVDAVDVYAKAVGMDDSNKRIMKIFKTHGPEAAFEAMTTREDGTPMSYAESRARYG